MASTCVRDNPASASNPAVIPDKCMHGTGQDCTKLNPQCQVLHAGKWRLWREEQAGQETQQGSSVDQSSLPHELLYSGSSTSSADATSSADSQTRRWVLNAMLFRAGAASVPGMHAS